MKEQIKEAFKELGFKLEEIEGAEWYGFSYEGKNYMYLYNEDEEFLSISIPGIFELEDGNEKTFTALEEMLNSTQRYVKANRIEDGLCLFYERKLLGEENLKTLLTHMIIRLDATLFAAGNFLSSKEKEEDEEGNDAGGQTDYAEFTDESDETDMSSEEVLEEENRSDK